MEYYDSNKYVAQIVNSFADANHKKYSKKFPKDIIEKMKQMNSEN